MRKDDLQKNQREKEKRENTTEKEEKEKGKEKEKRDIIQKGDNNRKDKGRKT